MSHGSPLGLFVLLIIYFVPSILAVRFEKSNAKKIFAINLFLGWTIIIWFVILFSACKTEVKPKRKPKILN